MSSDNQSVQISFKMISLVLALFVVGLLVYIVASQPWDKTDNSERRVIEARGEAIVDAEPDEFLFYPYWDVDAANEDQLSEETRIINNNTIAAIKELGIQDKDIKNNANGNEDWYYLDDQSDVLRASVYLEFSTNDIDIAQRATDYLVDNQAKGQLTPQSQFSNDLRKRLESEARIAAIADAKAKAQQIADGFDQKLGDLKSVQTSEDRFGYPAPATLEGQAEDSSTSSIETITIQPGQNELRYTLTAEFYLE